MTEPNTNQAPARSLSVKPSNYRTCVCGKPCKGAAALANHARVCAVEQDRSADFVNLITREDPSRTLTREAYNAKWPTHSLPLSHSGEPS